MGMSQIEKFRLSQFLREQGFDVKAFRLATNRERVLVDGKWQWMPVDFALVDMKERWFYEPDQLILYPARMNDDVLFKKQDIASLYEQVDDLIVSCRLRYRYHYRYCKDDEAVVLVWEEALKGGKRLVSTGAEFPTESINTDLCEIILPK